MLSSFVGVSDQIQLFKLQRKNIDLINPFILLYITPFWSTLKFKNGA